jgi:hypothetical protein
MAHLPEKRKRTSVVSRFRACAALKVPSMPINSSLRLRRAASRATEISFFVFLSDLFLDLHFP